MERGDNMGDSWQSQAKRQQKQVVKLRALQELLLEFPAYSHSAYLAIIGDVTQALHQARKARDQALTELEKQAKNAKA